MKTDYIFNRLEEEFINYNPYPGCFLSYKIKYSDIFDLSRSAVSRFGKDPTVFREFLNSFEKREYEKRVKRDIVGCSDKEIVFNDPSITDYIYCMIAIIQVDLECPGFIENFPEAKEYLILVNIDRESMIRDYFENIFNEVVETFNRYSEKNDLDYVKTLFGITDKDLEVKDCGNTLMRVDDYISKNFEKYWKSGNKEMKNYLYSYYVYQNTLLPEDYRDLLRYFRIDGYNDLEDDDFRLVDLYFKNQDVILEKAKDDIRIVRPEIMKKINLTMTE